MDAYKLENYGYHIHIEKGILQSEYIYQTCKSMGGKIAIIADSITAPLYATPLLEGFLKRDFKAALYTFSAGEYSKSRRTKETLEDALLMDGFRSDTIMVAVGGGVVTDLTGYIAATFCRGVPLIAVPTTLLGMVDASIGGKCGVNTKHGKNLIGTIKHPAAIFIDPETLYTLPTTQILQGFVEMLKHAAISNSFLFELYSQSFLSQNLPKNISSLIMENCRLKLKIVFSKQQELRHILNFGHTLGHAIEQVSSYRVPHGQAVATGIILESHISNRKGFLSEKEFFKIKEIFLNFHIPLKTVWTPKNIASKTLGDKKSLHQTPRIVLLKKIGRVHTCKQNFCHPVTIDQIEEILRKSHDLYHH
ncbi:MAG: 3-dehydroquinate synthase [Chlamydiales bacterium]